MSLTSKIHNIVEELSKDNIYITSLTMPSDEFNKFQEEQGTTLYYSEKDVVLLWTKSNSIYVKEREPKK